MSEYIPASRVRLADVILPDSADPGDPYAAGKVEQMILATTTDGTELYVIALNTGDTFAYRPDEYVTKVA